MSAAVSLQSMARSSWRRQQGSIFTRKRLTEQMLKTVNRLRNGIACASSPVSTAAAFRHSAQNYLRRRRVVPRSLFFSWRPSESASRKRSESDPQNPRSITAPQSMRMLMPRSIAGWSTRFRHKKPSFAVAVPQGWTPTHTARLKLGDDLVGDFIIEICPVLAGARPNRVSSTSRCISPRRAPAEPLSQPLKAPRLPRHSYSQPLARGISAKHETSFGVWRTDTPRSGPILSSACIDLVSCNRRRPPSSGS